MRHVIALAALLAVLAATASGVAQNDEQNSKTYEFEPQKVDADIPESERDEGAGDAEFDKVRNIDKKTFLGPEDSSTREKSEESESSEDSDD